VGVRFPWGNVLALRCGSLSAPLDFASGGLATRLRHRRIRKLGAFASAPAIRVVREGEGRRSYSLSPASADQGAAHL
jgi:hypothetical protein